MNELSRIIADYERAEQQGERAVLATVVNTEGSVYRRAGARMLVRFDAGGTPQTTGAISGGCLEADVCERAAEVSRTGVPVVVTYDAASDEDIVWGLGLGCDGTVEVLIEAADDEHAEDVLRFYKACCSSRERGVVATVFRVEGEPADRAWEICVGSRLLLFPDGTLAGCCFGRALVADVQAAQFTGVSGVKRYERAMGYVEVFIEAVEPPASLVVFGAGHDAVPVARLARELGWHVTVVDTRARPASRERFAAAADVVLCRPEEIKSRVALDERTSAVVMTHNYLDDREILRGLLPSPVAFVGCLGPKRRTERLLMELLVEGVASSAELLDRLHAPAGLDIGAETPEEIALSIVAEIKSASAGRRGGSLKDKPGSIHSRDAIAPPCSLPAGL